MKTFKFSLVLRTRENTDVFIMLDDNIYGIHSKRVIILYIFALQVFAQKRQLDVKIAVWSPWFYQIFFAKRQQMLLLLPTTSATSLSNYDVKTFEMK